MVAEGKLHIKFDTVQVSEKFARREFVLEFADNPMYPQFIKFECSQERCNLLDSFSAGDRIEVTFNLRGREWISPQGEKKYFTSLEAWRIQAVATATASNGQSPTRSIDELSQEGEGDLPF